MTSVYVSAALRMLVREQARNRCGYCLVPEDLHYGPLEFEHLVPRSLGGRTVEANLWLACRLCNSFKSDQIEGTDPETQQPFPLFNPRHDVWSLHFRWGDDAAEIIGITPTGRATVAALQLNSLDRLTTRRRWISVGWHPPVD